MTTRLYFRLVLVLRDSTVIRARTGNKRRIALKLRRFDWIEANLTVLYYDNDNVVAENSGRYTAMDDAQQALAAFCEADNIPNRTERLKEVLNKVRNINPELYDEIVDEPYG